MSTATTRGARAPSQRQHSAGAAGGQRRAIDAVAGDQFAQHQASDRYAAAKARHSPKGPGARYQAGIAGREPVRPGSQHASDRHTPEAAGSDLAPESSSFADLDTGATAVSSPAAVAAATGADGLGGVGTAAGPGMAHNPDGKSTVETPQTMKDANTKMADDGGGEGGTGGSGGGTDDKNTTGDKPLKIEADFSVEVAATQDLKTDKLGQVMPFSEVELTEISQEGDVVRVKGVHKTNLRWGLNNCTREDATPATATIDMEPESSRYAGQKVYQAMAMDMFPMPGSNAPVHAEYWSKMATEQHELFHVNDSTQWLNQNAKSAVEDAFEWGWFTADGVHKQLHGHTERARDVVFNQLYDYMVDGKEDDSQYYQRPGEVRAFGYCAPLLFSIAQSILQKGMAEEERAAAATQGDGTLPQGDVDSTATAPKDRKKFYKSAKGGTSPTTERQQTFANEIIPGEGSKDNAPADDGADSKDLGEDMKQATKAGYTPKLVAFKLTRDVQRDLVPEEGLGQVKEERIAHEPELKLVDGEAQIGMHLHIIYHWGAMANGTLPATTELATTDPETFGETWANMGLKNYEAMASDVMPQPGSNCPPQLHYWSEKHTIEHEMVHVEDDWAFMGQQAENMAKMWAAGVDLGQSEPDFDDATAMGKAYAARYAFLDSIADLSNAHYGADIEDHASRPGEILAHNTVAPGLQSLAMELITHGKSLEKQGL
ncbi:MAG: hypothetical protein KC502_02295 [Myxococcales bacterium]|nr:hypothetical protein [Myxococcales bacterium]